MQQQEKQRPSRVVRRKDLPGFVGVSLTQIDSLIKEGQFPQGTLVSATGRALVWFEDQILEWQQSRREQSK